jgi:hypothetical protein
MMCPLLRAATSKPLTRTIGLALMTLALAGCPDRPLDLPVGTTANTMAPDLALATPMDLAPPDLTLPDMALSNVPLPDMALPDLARSDMARPDLLASLPCQSVMVTTLAGNGMAGFFDGTGGANGTTEFYGVNAIATDSNGYVYVSDGGHRIRVIAPDDGSTRTLAGNGIGGYVDGTGGPNGTTQFWEPGGLAVDTAGYVYVAESQSNVIRKVAPDGTTTTIAGTAGDYGRGFMDGAVSKFDLPNGLAVDNSGNIYVADTFNSRIRKILSESTTITLAGNGNGGYVDGTGGPNGTTEFFLPFEVAVDSAGYVYVGDGDNARVRKVAPDGTTTTLAGNGGQGAVDGSGGNNGTAQLGDPWGVAVDGAGNVFVSDVYNRVIREIAPDGTTITIAGGVQDYGFVDGNGCAARFADPIAIAVFGKLVYVADNGNGRIRRIQLP